MGVIYKITNIINNKIYIGQTWTTEPQRWQNHIWHAQNNTNNDSPYLCNAIRKYGKENFIRKIIDTSDSVEELNNKEIYYIKLFNSTNPDIGYNICLGGDGHTKFDSKQLLNLYEQYQSITKISEILGASRDNISRRLKDIGIIIKNLTVIQYDINGNLINKYESFAEAKRQLPNLNLPRLIPLHKFASNFFWLREADNDDIQTTISNYKHSCSLQKEIQQYDEFGNYIASYKTAAEASRILNIDVSCIKSVLNCHQCTAGGYIWYKPLGPYSFEEIYNNFLLSKSCCKIEEIDEDGNVINTFNSAGEVEKMENWSYNSVKMVCDGKHTHTHNRIFRYANPNKRILFDN